MSSFLILGGLLILIFTFSPVLVQEINYQIKKTKPEKYHLVDSPDEIEVSGKEKKIVFQPKILIPVNFDFSLVIPKIGVNAQVFSNIDSANQEEYLPVLKKGVAHAKGSSLPNQPGVVFIFAHSTDSFFNITHYNAAFFLLNKLEPEDEIYIFFQNKKFRYQTIEKKIVNPEAVNQEIKNLSANYLILQTCYPPGTTLKRLIVIAQNLN